MDRKYIEEKVKEFGKWYQRIDLDGIITHDSENEGGDFVWDKMKTLLPESLEGKRILDIGCNAGYYSVQSSLLGADEVVGVEVTKRYFDEALFIKEFYEDKYNKKLNIKFLNVNVSNLEDLGKFDYIYAIAVLYHIGAIEFGKGSVEAIKEQERVISNLCKMTDVFIIRTTKRKRRTTEFFKPMFSKNGFEATDIIDEGIRSLVKFQRI